MIDIEGLRFTYRGGDRPALDGVDLKIGSGEFVLVIGESGSGKTTLAKIIAGLLGPGHGEMEGSVKIAGEDCRARPAVSKPVVALVQQDPESQVVTLCVEDEVAFGPENFGLDRDEIRRRVTWSLGAVGASHLAGRDISTLSGGELQKIAIASMLALGPQVLILDEPSSSLDPRSALQLAEVLGGLNSEGMTVIVVEHHYRWIMPKVGHTVAIRGGVVSPVRGGMRYEKPAVRGPAPGRSPGGVNLSLQDVTFDYGGEVALNGVSLDLHRGEALALMGDNGSGKSTLLLTIMGFLRPSGGRVLLEERSWTATSRLSEKIGVVFQSPNHQILESTVKRELLFGPRNFGLDPGESDRRALEIMGELGLARHADSNPHRLSIGEKRRLNVGSVAIYGPAVYLLDEPFIGQDAGNTRRIMELLRDRLDHGSSCMIATHDSDFAAEHCDRIAFLRQGSVAYVGRPREVFAKLEEEGETCYLPSKWGESFEGIVP